MSSDSQMDELIMQLESGELLQQLDALREILINRVHIPSFVLFPLLSSPDPDVQDKAADVLGYIGHDQVESVGPALIALLDDRDSSVRYSALESLMSLEYSEARPKIEQRLKLDTDPLVRTSAANALGEFGDLRSQEALLSALKDDSEPLVRASAAYSIGLLGDTHSLPVLRRHTETEVDEEVVHSDLLLARYMLGDRDVLIEVIARLDTDDAMLGWRLTGRLNDLARRFAFAQDDLKNLGISAASANDIP